MARRSIRSRFVIGTVTSALVALLLFAAGSFAVVLIDDTAEAEIRHGNSYRVEAAEIIFGAMVVALPLGVVAAITLAVLASRRSAAPLDAAIRAARATTAQDLRKSLPVPARDDELRDLVIALNELFVRLDDGFGALGRFAAEASHELRTPLAVMATELEVALRHPRSVAEWEATGRSCLEDLHRVSDLVEGLLALARAGADAPAARSKVQLVECVDAVVAQLSTKAEGAGVSLAPPVEASSRQVDVNPVMIETAIRNLVENAIAALPRGGQIRITIDERAAETSVVVDDDGPGLGDDPERLFAPFARGEGGNVGLGLAIARRVAVAHGGRLTASASPLGGARFTLALPA